MKRSDALWAIALVLILCLFGCHKPAGVNGDPQPQPGHTTHVTPKTAQVDVIPQNQADIDRLTQKYGPPTAICNNGAMTWHLPRKGTCTGRGEGGIGEWLAGATT